MVPQPLDETTSRRLRRQSRRDTAPEMAVRKHLWAMGYKFRLHVPITSTRRTIDIAFRRFKVAVFVDGCFWHGCSKHMTKPKNNSQWWLDKLEANRHRDFDTNRRLRKQGWVVIRIWEHEDPRIAARRVQRAIEKRRLLITSK